MIIKFRNIYLTFVVFLALTLFAGAFLPQSHQVSASDSVTVGAKRYKLQNGLTVILKENPASKVCSVQVWVRTGSANETEKEAGITHLIEHMIFKGTSKRRTGEIARTIEAAGGEINAYTSYDRTVYYVEIASSHLDIALDVLLDAVQHSVFDPVELEKEKEVVLEEYRRGLDSPSRELGKAVMRLCFKKHPYRRPIIGYEKTIQSFDRNAILAYLDKWYTPQNMVIVVVGDFEAQRVLNLIKALTRDFPRRKWAIAKRPAEPPQRKYRQEIIRRDVRQAYVDISWHIPALSHPDTAALDVMEIILGHGKSSRLYNRIKARLNLVQDIDASAWEMKDSGLFSIDATLPPGNLPKVLEQIAQIIRQLQDTPVSQRELIKAKTIVEADFLYSMETASGQARTLGFFEAMTQDMKNCDTYLQQVRAVTAQEILEMARKYLRPANMSLVAMLPRDQVVQLNEANVQRLFENPMLNRAEKCTGRDVVTEPKKVALSNGLRIIVKENHSLPIVSIAATMLGGTRLEPKGKWGLSRFVANMLTRGTATMSASEISREVETMGGRLETFSGRNSLGLTAKFLSRDFARGISLLGNVLTEPAFPEDEVEKVRTDMLQTIKTKQDRPMAQLFDLFYSTLYKHHPYGHPQTGTQETIKAISRDDLINWYRKMSDPSNMAVAVVGDIDADTAIQMLSARFSDLPSHHYSPRPTPPEPPLTCNRTAVVHKKAAQVNFVLGFLDVGLRNPLNAPMEILNTVLSGQGGRLFYRLRDQQSLAYAVTSFRRPGLETGAFGIYMGCAPEKFSLAKEAVLGEMEALRAEGITSRELQMAKDHLLGMLAIERQTNGSQAFNMALNELYGLGYRYDEKFAKKIRQVTLKEIKEAIKSLITPDRYVLVAIGPQRTGIDSSDQQDSRTSADDADD